MKIQEQVNTLVNKEVVSSRWLTRVIGVTSFILLTALGAYVWIPLPFTPVPVTLQTFFVLLSGAVLGGRLGALSQLGYWVIGGLGLPLFAGGTFGLQPLLGPTGGYLIGFIVASWIVSALGGFAFGEGWLNGKARFGEIFLIFLLASSLILLFGASWLAIFLHCSLKKAIFLGILPFIPGDILKAVFASLMYNKIQHRTKYLFG